MRKDTPHRFPLSKVRWPAMSEKVKQLFRETQAHPEKLMLNLPKSPRVLSRDPFNIIRPWKVWRGEEEL